MTRRHVAFSHARRLFLEQQNMDAHMRQKENHTFSSYGYNKQTRVCFEVLILSLTDTHSKVWKGVARMCFLKDQSTAQHFRHHHERQPFADASASLASADTER